MVKLFLLNIKYVTVIFKKDPRIHQKCRSKYVGPKHWSLKIMLDFPLQSFLLKNESQNNYLGKAD